MTPGWISHSRCRKSAQVFSLLREGRWTTTLWIAAKYHPAVVGKKWVAFVWLNLIYSFNSPARLRAVIWYSSRSLALMEAIA